MTRTLTCLTFLFVCWTTLPFVFAEETDQPKTSVMTDPLDRVLAELAAAAGTFDVERAEKLFLPPDETAEGKNRQAHLAEIRKDWSRAKEGGAKEGISVRFENAKKILRTQMVVSGPGSTEEAERMDVELTVTLTKDGWKIVSMEFAPKQ